MRARIIFDLLLTAVLLFEVLHQITGNTLHEIAGAAFFVCIIVHLAFASNWIKSAGSTFRAGELAGRQRQLLVVAILLALDMVVLLVSSIIISELLWSIGIDMTWANPGNIWYPVHTVAAYALCILVLAHLAMHWSNVAGALSVQYDPSRRAAISQAVNGIAMIGGIALGVTGVARAGFQASDYVVEADVASSPKTVESGYREVNAQTGQYTSIDAFEAASLSDDVSDGDADNLDAAEDIGDSPICPICPRQCKLSAPRCNRPYEAGLIS